MKIEVKLVKELGYERISCVCGTAVFPKDPTPEISEMVKQTAIQNGAGFSIVDTSIHPEVIEEYSIAELPAVIINRRVVPVTEEAITKAINMEKCLKMERGDI